eukprot:scaffold17502_cov61-Cyclotella_meneghiniana.AAC.1
MAGTYVGIRRTCTMVASQNANCLLALQTTRQSHSTNMTATFIDLATATTSHYQPLDSGISSTIDNVYLVHRLLFATNFCHRPTHFRTSSDPHHIVGDCAHMHSLHPAR